MTARQNLAPILQHNAKVIQHHATIVCMYLETKREPIDDATMEMVASAVRQILEQEAEASWPLEPIIDHNALADAVIAAKNQSRPSFLKRIFG